jgi:TonB family protein
MERPAAGVSWVLAVTGSCLGVGVVGLARPVEWVARVPVTAALVAEEEMPMLELAGEAAALGEEGEATEVAEEEVGVEAFPEVAVALTVEDVFAVPAAVPMEPMLREERVARDAAPRAVAPPVATRKPAVSRGGPGAGAGTGRPTGSAQGTGEGSTGGGTAGAGRGRTAGYFPTPPYPAQARSRGQQGTVQLLIVFGADGRVTSATVSRSSGFSDLDRAAAVWVRRHWRGATGQVGSFRLPVHFQLR